MEEYASIRELIASVNTSAFLVTYLVRLPTTGLSGQVRTPHVAGVPVEVQKFGNKTSRNSACDIALVKSPSGSSAQCGGAHAPYVKVGFKTLI